MADVDMTSHAPLRALCKARVFAAADGHVAIELNAVAECADGHEPTIDDFKAHAATRPPTIVAVVDNSGSMEKHGLLLKASLEALVRAAPQGTQLGVLLFDDSTRVAVPMTKLEDEAACTAVVNMVKPHITVDGFSTNIHSAVMSALDMALAAPAAEVTVVLLTDGDATSGEKLLPDDILAAAHAHAGFAKVNLHCIGFGHEQASVGAPLLCALSLARNGAFNRVGREEDVGAAFGDCLASVLTTLLSNVRVRMNTAAEWLTTANVSLKHKEPYVLVARLPLPLPATVEVTVQYTDVISNTTAQVTLPPVVIADAMTGDGEAFARAHAFRERCVRALTKLQQTNKSVATVDVAPSHWGGWGPLLAATYRVPPPSMLLPAPSRVLLPAPAIINGALRTLGAPEADPSGLLPAHGSHGLPAPSLLHAIATDIDDIVGIVSDDDHQLAACVSTAPDRSAEEAVEAHRQALEAATRAAEERAALVRAARATVDAAKAALKQLMEEATAAVVKGGCMVQLYMELRDKLRDVVTRTDTAAGANITASFIHAALTQRPDVTFVPSPMVAALAPALSTVSDVAHEMRQQLRTNVLRSVTSVV